MISLRTVPSSTALIVCASTGPSMATASNRPVRTLLRELPATAFRRWVDGLGSVFGVIGFIVGLLLFVLVSMLLRTQLKFLGRIERHQPGDEHRHVERAGDGFHQIGRAHV